MNLKNLLEMQRKLDVEILERAGIKEYPFRNIKIALLVELGELANEWKGFKHWKKNKFMNREKLLEEWSDCFHFALSLENELNQRDEEILYTIDKIIDSNKDFNIDMCAVFEQAYECVLDEQEILSAIIILGRYLGISLDEMEQAYLDKNKVNHDRQASGY